MLLKASIKDICSLLDKKSNSDDVSKDITQLKAITKQGQKEFKKLCEEQQAINEALCSENCVARWVWKNGEIDGSNQSNGLVKWDMQSVNTCPDNFIWKGGNSSVKVEAPGLYELTVAFFSKKKKPIL